MPRTGRPAAWIARACAALVVATVASMTDPGAPLEVPVARAASTPPCVDGHDVVAPTSRMITEAVVARSGDSAMFAGGRSLHFGRRQAAIARFDRQGWQ